MIYNYYYNNILLFYLLDCLSFYVNMVPVKAPSDIEFVILLLNVI